MLDLGDVRPGSTIRIPFSTFDKDDGSSITMTNYAAADILVYKDGGTTERASTAGFTATTDFDSKSGKHLAVIDLADNTTANFWAAGSEYLVAIDAVTVDAVTTGGWIARFRIGYRQAMLDTTIASLSSQTSFTLTVGPAEDDALNGMWAVIHDVASAVQWSKVLISDYTGSTKTVTLAAGGTFTAAAGDNFSVIDLAPLQAATTGRTLVVDSAGLADANAVKIGPTGSGTAQTARDIGASVLLSSGTGTGQLKLASGYVAMTWADIAAPTTTVNLSGTTIATTQKVDVETIKTNPVVNGGTLTFPSGATLASTTNITAGTITTATNVTTVNGLASGVITATSIAADAITDAKVASDVTIASVTGSVGSVTGAVGSVAGAVGSVTAVSSGAITEASFATTAGSFAPLGIIDQGTAQSATGTTLVLRSAATFADDELIGALVTITGGSAGVGQTRRITDYVSSTDTATVDTWTVTPTGTIIYKVFAETASGTPPTAAAIADAVWDEAISGHAVSGSTGEALSAAGAAGDPWITALPGSYSAGQAGYIMGTNLNATVSSRSMDTEVAAIKAKTDNLPADPADASDIAALVDALPTAAENATAIWAAGARTLTAIDEDSTTLDLDAAIRAALGMASANLDTQLGNLPTALENADAWLTRDMSDVDDSASPGVRMPLDAFRHIRNKWDTTSAPGFVVVRKEDDTTEAWRAALATDAGAEPITGSDPT